MLTKDQILAAKDFETVEIKVPQWDGKVKIRTLSELSMNKYSLSLTGDQKNWVNAKARLCVLSIVDEKDKLMFTEKDANLLGQKSAASIDIIFEAAQKLNRLTDEDIKELEKN